MVPVISVGEKFQVVYGGNVYGVWCTVAIFLFRPARIGAWSVAVYFVHCRPPRQTSRNIESIFLCTPTIFSYMYTMIAATQLQLLHYLNTA